MGMPLPVALARLRRLDPALDPWAWGANGCASVLGPVLVPLLSVQYGQTRVIVTAALPYAAAAVAASRLEERTGINGNSSGKPPIPGTGRVAGRRVAGDETSTG